MILTAVIDWRFPLRRDDQAYNATKEAELEIWLSGLELVIDLQEDLASASSTHIWWLTTARRSMGTYTHTFPKLSSKINKDQAMTHYTKGLAFMSNGLSFVSGTPMVAGENLFL